MKLLCLSKRELDYMKLLMLTVKQVGGGSSFIKTTAAGGTGKTPPGTGCKPGAVGGWESSSEILRKHTEQISTKTLSSLEQRYVRARWRGWKGIIWLVSGLGYSGLRSASSFSAGTEGATTVSGSSAASLARDTSFKHTHTHRRDRFISSSHEGRHVTCFGCRRVTHLVSKGLEFTGRAGIQVHELVSVHEQSRFFALILVLESRETPALHFQDTGQVSYVALEGQESSPDFTEETHESTLTDAVTVKTLMLINAHHYPDFSGDKLPEVRTRSNRTLVLLSSGEKEQTPTGSSMRIEKGQPFTKYIPCIDFVDGYTRPTVKVWQVINIRQYVLWNVAVFLQTKLEDLEGHWFIL